MKAAARKPRMSDTDMKRKLPPFLRQLRAEWELQIWRFNQQIAKEAAEAHFMKIIDRSQFRAVYKGADLNQKGVRPQKILPKS